MSYRKAICAIIKKEDKYLIVNSKGWNQDIWCFVQGGIEDNEKEKDAVAREIREEVGDCRFEIIERSKFVHKYEFPKKVQQKKGYVGQEQAVWFVEFLDNFDDVMIPNNENQQYKWVKKEEILSHFAFQEQIDFFKRALDLK